MKLTLASPRGFCAGVDMAVESLNLALSKFGPPVYVFHEIVHNRTIVETFQEQGAVFVDSLSEVPEGGTVLFSAHGISPAIRAEARERKLTAIDATCPLVTKVHLEAIRFSEAGYQILLIGHAGHDEVIGTMGEAPGSMRLVQSAEEAEALPPVLAEKLAYLTQTTLSVDETAGIIAVLKRKYPHIVAPPKEDICYATQNRQEAVRALAPEADLVIVIGSANSSNSQRLVEIARQLGKTACLVDTIHGVPRELLQGKARILLTAGASAPEHLVTEARLFITEHFGATVETRTLKTEKVAFGLPKELR